jgi:hypothetical protein
MMPSETMVPTVLPSTILPTETATMMPTDTALPTETVGPTAAPTSGKKFRRA